MHRVVLAGAMIIGSGITRYGSRCNASSVQEVRSAMTVFLPVYFPEPNCPECDAPAEKSSSPFH